MGKPDLPALIAGRYRPVRVIGKGGMGVVYEVEHVHTGQHFALKAIAPNPAASAERFKREARAASKIQSDHIVRVTDADIAPELDGAPFLVMELLEGEDLDHVTANRPAAPGDVVEWLRQVARALDKAHAAGIVHRDLKPANLFLTRREDGSPLVKILDFGIAKIAAESTVLTGSGSILGTPGFMAPEQIDSEGPPVTFQSDLYSIGLIAFRLLTGHNYWKSGSLPQLLGEVIFGPMPPPSERGSTLGPAFDAWFLRACNRDTGKRFDSAGVQVLALAQSLGLPEPQRVSDISAPRLAEGEVVPTLSSLGSLAASSSDVKASRMRFAKRRWFAGGLLGAIGALWIVATFLSRGGDREGSKVPALVDAADLPNAHASVNPSVSSAALSTRSVPQVEVAIDAGAPLHSSSPSPALPPDPVSAIKPRKPAPAPTKGQPAAPAIDPVWRER